MDKPLLNSLDVKKFPGKKALFIFCFGAWLIFAVGFQREEEVAAPDEVAVGVNLEWRNLLVIFFGLGWLPKNMKHSQPYAGQQNPNLPMSRCAGEFVRNCHHICLDRLRNPGIGPPAVELPEPAQCTRSLVAQTQVQHSCWDPSKMRCWNSIRGGNMLWDGSHEWQLLRHWQGDIEPRSSVSINWMHARSIAKKIDLIVFSWGMVRPIPEICDQMEILSGLPQRIQMIPPSQAVVIMGHSEGSGWAACTNKYMYENKLPHVRRVIASAALLATVDFVENMDVESKQNSLFLLVGIDTKRGLSGAGGVIPDVFTIIPPPIGATFPQFGYVCRIDMPSGEYVCLDPQPTLDIGDGLRRAGELQGLMASFVIRDIHPFSTYKLCYQACLRTFERNDWDFTPNVDTYIKGSSVQTAASSSNQPLRPPGTAQEVGSSSSASSGTSSGMPSFLGPASPLQMHPSPPKLAGPSSHVLPPSAKSPDHTSTVLLTPATERLSISESTVRHKGGKGPTQSESQLPGPSTRKR